MASLRKARSARSAHKTPPKTKTAFQQQLDAKVAAKKKFLFTFAKVGNVTATCQETGTARRTHYDWLAEDPEYAGRFQDAKIEAAEWLEVEARRRAVTGEVVDRYYKGQKVAGGAYRKRSDMLLWNMLKSLKPDVYDRANYDPSRQKEPDVAEEFDVSKLSDEVLDQLADEIEQVRKDEEDD